MALVDQGTLGAARWSDHDLDHGLHGRFIGTREKSRTFNIIDDFNRKAIAVEADFSFAAMGMAQVPKRTIGEHGRPENVRVHHGPEFLYAFSACKHNKANREIHERLTKKGKSKKLALIAVSNKLLKQAFAIVESGLPYDEHYISKLA